MKRALLLGLLSAACGRESPYPDALDPNVAPVAAIDRFGDGYAALFKRSMPGFNPSVTQEIIPGPNEPIDFDAHFLNKALGPDGSSITYYALDMTPATPARAFVVLDQNGAPLPGQLPVIESVPGDEGYSDYVLVTEVLTGDLYEANQLTMVAQIDEAAAAGTVLLRPTERLLNWPLVPAGTTATLAFAGEPVAGGRAWRNGEIVHYLAFETLAPDENGEVPRAYGAVIFVNGMDGAQGFLTETGSDQTHNVFETLPGDPGYSSLWSLFGIIPAFFDEVVDWPTADTYKEYPIDGFVNCPIVAE